VLGGSSFFLPKKRSKKPIIVPLVFPLTASAGGRRPCASQSHDTSALSPRPHAIASRKQRPAFVTTASMMLVNEASEWIGGLYTSCPAKDHRKVSCVATFDGLWPSGLRYAVS